MHLCGHASVCVLWGVWASGWALVCTGVRLGWCADGVARGCWVCIGAPALVCGCVSVGAAAWGSGCTLVRWRPVGGHQACRRMLTRGCRVHAGMVGVVVC